MSLTKRDALVGAIDVGIVDPTRLVADILDHVPDSVVDEILAKHPVVNAFYEENKDDFD